MTLAEAVTVVLYLKDKEPTEITWTENGVLEMAKSIIAEDAAIIIEENALPDR